jgi:hypothetical protein
MEEIESRGDDDENEQFGNTVEEGQSEGLESMIKEFEVEVEGAPLDEKVAKAINTVWRKPRDSEGYKNAARRAKKPENVHFSKVAVNDELYGLLPQGLKAQDARLKSIQSMLCKAAVPSACLLNEIETNMNMPPDQKKKCQRYIIDNISLIAHASNSINYQRRESIKRKLPPNYAMVLKSPDGTADTLFGDECSDNLKKAGYGGKIQKDVKQYQQNMQFNQRRRGRGMERGRGFRGRPYPIRRGRGGHFLGKIFNYIMNTVIL